MTKPELLNLNRLVATNRMIKTVKEDKGKIRTTVYHYSTGSYTTRVYNYYHYLLAEEEKGILKVAIFTRIHLAAGDREPDFTIFIDKEKGKWNTYNHAEDKWSNSMIHNLDIVKEPGENYQSLSWCNAASNRVIQKYFNTKSEGRKAIREYQTSIREDAIKKKHRSEKEQIDEYMELVPELPKDFNEWVIKSAYKNDSYIIYKPKATEGYCTHCMKIVKINRPKHNDNGKCPNCRAEILYKSYGKQKVLEDRKNVGIMQQLKDKSGYVLRVFKTGIKYRKEREYLNPETWIHEVYRFRYSEYFAYRETFEYGEYRHSGVTRWCHELNHGYGWNGNYPSTHCVLYEKNVDKLLAGTVGKYIPLKKLLQKEKSRAFHAEYAFETCISTARYSIEKLIKVGLYKLAMECMEKRGYINEIAHQCNKLEDILRLDKEYTRQAIEVNVDSSRLRVLQAAYRAKVRLTPELVELTHDFYDGRIDDIQIVLERGNVEKMMHYLYKVAAESKMERRTVGRDYNDYLEQLDELHMPKDKHNRFPANFYQTHNQLSELIREKDDAIKKAATRKQNAILKKLVKELEKQYYAKSDEYVIVWPKSKVEFQTEGQLQHNCVGGYFERAAQGKTVIFFLRKKEAPDTPYCTVEFQRGKLIQCRTMYNREADEEAMKYMHQIEENYKKIIDETLVAAI